MPSMTRSTWGLTATRDEPWQTYASCGREDPQLWETPTLTTSGGIDALRAVQGRRAIAICRSCPVIAECHADAEDAPPRGMIRAGIPYSDAGNPARRCMVCDRYVLSAHALALYCESHGRYALQVAERAKRDAEIAALAAANHSDEQIAEMLGSSKEAIRKARERADIPSGLPQGVHAEVTA